MSLSASYNNPYTTYSPSANAPYGTAATPYTSNTGAGTLATYPQSAAPQNPNFPLPLGTDRLLTALLNGDRLGNKDNSLSQTELGDFQNKLGAAFTRVLTLFKTNPSYANNPAAREGIYGALQNMAKDLNTCNVLGSNWSSLTGGGSELSVQGLIGLAQRDGNIFDVSQNDVFPTPSYGYGGYGYGYSNPVGGYGY